MNLPENITCEHCYNISSMKVLGTIDDEKIYEDPDLGSMLEFIEYYRVLECPACNKVTIINYYWHETHDGEEREVPYKVLYPSKQKIPKGVPDNLTKTYLAAEKVKNIDTSSYALLTRRLLELICIDRKAEGKILFDKLKDLASKNEIPKKLINVADKLRLFGNIGAHEEDNILKPTEVPVIKALINAILEYIYTAPYLAELAEKKLNRIKRKTKKK